MTLVPTPEYRLTLTLVPRYRFANAIANAIANADAGVPANANVIRNYYEPKCGVAVPPALLASPCINALAL